MPDNAPESATSTSLLVRLQQAPADQAAWEEFVRRYGARIHGWGRGWGLQEADAQDVSQDVLLKLVRAMQAFRYDPARRFRGWLKTVAHHAWQDLARGRKVIAAGGDPAADEVHVFDATRAAEGKE
jgi:RNA polymerase sigma-70 factor (ECF subfamily)